MEVEVAGDRVSGWRAFWKTPEAFDRTRDAQTFWSILVIVARIAALTFLGVFGMICLIHNIRAGLVRWKPALIIGAVAAAFLAIDELLASPLALKNYPTSIPFRTFLITEYAGFAIAALFGFLFFAVAAGLVISYFPGALAAWRGANRRKLGIDAGFALLASIGFGLLAHRLEGFFQLKFPALALFSIDSPDFIATPAPSVASISSALIGVLVWAGAAVTLALILKRWGARWFAAMALIAVAMLVPGDARTAGEFAFHYGFALFTAALLTLWCVRFARNNYLAYALAFWAVGIQSHASSLLQTAIPAFQAQGWAVLAVGVIGAVAVIAPALVGGKAESEAALAAQPSD